MANFDDLQGAVAQFGAGNKVIYDDIGMPSIMVGVPKMKYSDIITGGTEEVLPFFIVDGEEKEAIYVSKFANIVENDRAYSLGMKLPRDYITFDQAVAACKAKGNGWHLNQTGNFAVLNLLSQKIITMPTSMEYNRRGKRSGRLRAAVALHGITITICRALQTLTAWYGNGPADSAL